jgi:rubrerythrin
MHPDMKGMEEMHHDHTGAMKKKSEETRPMSKKFYYTCVMHPQIHEGKPGKCPICGMTLVKKEEDQK